MELNPNHWHVKFYFWCLDVWDAFLDTHTKRHTSNLCQYIRTIFVWMPLALVVNVGFWLYVFYALLYFPLTHFGVVGTAAGYLAIGLFIGAIWAFTWLYSFTEDRLDDRRYERHRAARRAAIIALGGVTEQEERGPGFIEVIWLYLVAMKRRVCPMITFGADRMQEDA